MRSREHGACHAPPPGTVAALAQLLRRTAPVCNFCSNWTLPHTPWPGTALAVPMWVAGRIEMRAANSVAADAAWSVLEAAPDAMLVADASGRIEFLNTQTERMFGYARAELLREPLEKLLPLRFREQHALHMARFLALPRARPMGQGLELH